MADATQVADKALNMVASFGEQLKELGAQMAPQAWELAKGAAQISALSDLMTGVICGILAAILVVGLWKTSPKWGDWFDATDGAITIVIMLIVGLAGVVLLVALDDLLDPWAWAGLFHPDLYIAHKLLKL